MKIKEAELRKKISGLLREFFLMSLAKDGDEENTEPTVLKRALGASRPDYEDDGRDGGYYDYGLEEIDEVDIEDDE